MKHDSIEYLTIRNLTHTETCKKKTLKRKLQQDKWKAKWPNHCKRCLANTNCENPCLHCLYKLNCPRCGAENAMDFEDATIPCKFCGYVEGEDAGCPHDYVCTCRVAKFEAAKGEYFRAQSEQQAIRDQIEAIRDQIERLKRTLL